VTSIRFAILDMSKNIERITAILEELEEAAKRGGTETS
jgi:hypothetical protein